MNEDDLEHHENKCFYRKVVCPNNCKEDDKVLFKDVIDHLKKCLIKPAIYEEKMSNGEGNKFLVEYCTSRFGLKDGKSWSPGKMTTSCGAVFFNTAYIENKVMYFLICILGSSDEAKKYSCTFSIKNEIGEKFIYSGPVHTIDKGKDDIIASGSVFMMGLNAVRNSLNEDKELEVEVAIRNLKEEAKDEDSE
jgi:hypothetical protein